MKIGVILATILVFCMSAFAIEDTYANREAEANKYLEAISVKNMLIEIVDSMGDKLSSAQKKEFRDVMLTYLDINAFIADMKDVMIKHYTAEELAAMSAFYSSDIGKSILKKTKAVTSEMAPKAQNAALRALLKMQKEKAKTKQQEKSPVNNSM